MFIFVLPFKLIECLVLGVIAAWLAIFVSDWILETAEPKIEKFTRDAKLSLALVYQASSACVGLLIIGGFAFSASSLCLRVVCAVIAILAARAYLRIMQWKTQISSLVSKIRSGEY